MTIVEITYALPSKRGWKRCPLRKSTKGRGACRICGKWIERGSKYYDRGFGRLAHEECVAKMEK